MEMDRGVGDMKPKLDGPALKWLGAEFRKLIPPVPTNDEFANLCKLLDR